MVKMRDVIMMPHVSTSDVKCLLDRLRVFLFPFPFPVPVQFRAYIPTDKQKTRSLVAMLGIVVGKKTNIKTNRHKIVEVDDGSDRPSRH